MEYTVIMNTGRIMTFYIKEAAVMFAASNNGTFVSNEVLDDAETCCL